MAGNVQIEGLYSDPFLTLIQRPRQSKFNGVSLSGQDYPFPSPTGIFYRFHRLSDTALLSVLTTADSDGNAGLKPDWTVLLSSTFSLSIGTQTSYATYATYATYADGIHS